MKKQILSLSIALLSLTVAKAQQIFVDEDFNAGILPTGWTDTALTGSDLWLFGIDGSSTVPGNNNLDSTNMAYFDDDDLGPSASNNTPALITPSFDNSLSGITNLKFDYNFREFGPPKDSFYVQVFDGAVWQTIFSVDVDSCGDYRSVANGIGGKGCSNGFFPRFTADISAYANANCQVRFVYHDGNDPNANNFGWGVGLDNVSITSPLDNDIELTEFLVPAIDACGLDSNQQLVVKIKNKGTSPAFNFDLSVDVDNGAQTATETISDTIPGGDSLIYTTNATFDLEAARTYNLTGFVAWGPDAGSLNDTIKNLEVTNEPAFTLPYSDDFETLKDSSDWRTFGRNSSWDLGFPDGPVISFAGSGNFAWVTNLKGNYNDNELSFLQSPCIDLSDEAGDPYVSFDIYYDTESEQDSLNLFVSTDKGDTWELVPTSPLAKNWYNAPKGAPFGWAVNSSGWLRAESVLKGAAGSGEVMLRFKFFSDSRTIGNEDGVAIDNLSITPSDSIDLSIAEMVFPENGFLPACGYAFENIIVHVHNRGFSDVDSFQVGFQVDNNPPVTETVVMNLPAFSRTNYAFQTPADLVDNKNYDITTWVRILGDGNTSNDTIPDIRISNANAPNSITSPIRYTFEENGFSPGTVVGNANSTFPGGWVRSQSFTFQVANSAANLPALSGPASDHTGNNGNFIYTEPTVGNQGEFAVLETPCLNFSRTDGVTLEFWYHALGGPYPGGVRIDVFDGLEWDEEVDIINTFPQTNRNSPWTFYSQNLDQYAGKNIKIRFRVEHPGGFSARTVFAIDDMVIFNPIDQDAEMVSVDGPNPDCSVGQNSFVDVTINNFGLQTIPADSLFVFYQVQTQNDTVQVKDTVRTPIQPRNQLQFTFSTPADLSIPGQTYEILAWTELNGDSNVGNDSVLDFTITNLTRLPGYIEDFESNQFFDGSCLNPSRDVFARGWTVNNAQFTWNLQDARVCRGANGSTPTFNTGPDGDHTTPQGNGTFVYAESSMSGNTEAELTSPCIDFSNSTGAALAFWYHKFGAGMGDIFIDVLSDGVWNMGVDTVIGETQIGINDPWKLKSVNLGNFAGKTIQIRFRGTRGSSTSDMAIDDIEIFEPIPNDARVSAVLTPVTECDPDGQVEVRVENFGLDTIFANNIRVSFSINGAPPISDTVDVTLGPGEFVNHIFDKNGFFRTPNTTFNMLSWTELVGDSNTFNDTTAYRFTNLTQTIQYTEDFEAFRDGNLAANCGNPFSPDVFVRGWEANPIIGNTAHWNVHSANCGNTPVLGNPRIDATRGNGNFFYFHSSVPGDTAFLNLPCIDFRNETTAGMFFSYHTFGNGGGVLAIEVFDDSTGKWVEVDRLTGSDQIANTSDWLVKFVKMEQFAGRLLEIRFRAIRSGATALAIDDIGFYLPKEQDAEILDILSPTSGCEVYDQSIVTVRFKNFGTKDFKQDSLDLYYQIDNLPPVREAFSDPTFGDIVEDTVITYTFNTPADLNINGKTYNIKAWTALKGEENVSNDTIFEFTVENTTKSTVYFENMETFRDASCVGALGQVTENGWVVTSGTSGYTWHVQSSLCRGGFDKATPTTQTGPVGDHTTGDGMFLYVDAGNNDFANAFSESELRGTATFESPCIDLRPNTNPKLSFWYHRYGRRMGDLFVDVRPATPLLFYTQSFEDSTGYSFPNGRGGASTENFFDRTDSAGAPAQSSFNYAGYDSTYFIAAEDIDNTLSNSRGVVLMEDIDIRNQSNLRFIGSFASATNNGIDTLADSISIQVNIDNSGWTTIGKFEADTNTTNSSGLNGQFAEDLDLDGYGEGTRLDGTFRDFSWDIEGSGNSLDIRIIVDLDSDNEEAAFDNIRLEGINWYNAFQLNGQSQSSGDDLWKQAVVDLERFVDKRVLLRFRAKDNATSNPQDETGIFGDMAIDDIQIYEQDSLDVSISEMPSPGISDGCGLGTVPVTVKLENLGFSKIDSGAISLRYIYGGKEVFDTLRQALDADSSINFTFADLLDLTEFNGVNDLRVIAKLDGDQLVENNEIRREINNRQPGLPRYFMDFENHSAGVSYNANDMQGWRRTPRNGGVGTYMWHVQCGAGPWVDGMIPVPPAGPPSGPSGDHTFSNTFQNGVGCYMLVESNLPNVDPTTIPNALLELPCGEMDFSQSRNNKILMSYWYHMFGSDVGDLFVDVHDGDKWVNRIDVIRGNVGGHQDDDTERWRRRQVVLDRFAGLSKVKIRFRAAMGDNGLSGRSGDIGVDDVEILDRASNDARIARIIDPESDCNLGTTERFRVELQNMGTDDILETILGYQITFTPLTRDSGLAVEPIVFPVKKDTAVGINGFIAPLAFQTFTFDDRLDMSEPGSYEIKVWTEIEGDKNFFNDTIVETIVNDTRPFPFCEDFSSMTLGETPLSFRDGVFPNAWTGSTSPTYFFTNGMEGAGPTIGHTGGNNDLYLLINPAIPPGVTATIESACYDLTNTPAAIMEFWYQAPFDGHEMFVDARTLSGGWQRIDTVQGFAKFQWTKETIVLTDFVGDFVQVRFTAVNLGSYYAIDDVCIKAPDRQQIQLESIVTPRPGLCLYTDRETVRIRVQNIGLDRIDSFQVNLAVDSAVQNFPIGKTINETVWVDVSNAPFFDPGDEIDVVLNLPRFLVDMSAQDVSYFFNVKVILEGDNNLENNEISDLVVFHPIGIELPYVETFELVKGEGDGPNYSNGIFAQGGDYYWQEASGTTVGVRSLTDFFGLSGPPYDHTKKNDDGVYMTTDATALSAGDPAALTTRCIDLTEAINPQLSYWYYMFGADMGQLFVQVNADAGWVDVDSLKGMDQRTQSEEWKKREIDLGQFKGSSVRIRFLSLRGGGPSSNMAIDDLSVVDLAAIDVTPSALAKPNSDTTSCYTKEQEVIIELSNNGSDSIDYSVDTSFVRVDVFKQGALFATLFDTIVGNIWQDENGIFKPLPPDSSALFTLDSTFDMSDTGIVYRFNIVVITSGDVITQNDQLQTTVLSQRKGGFVSRAIPNDVICFGNPVRLRLENHFGAVSWEEKTLTRSGFDFWFPGLSFPNNERIYQTIPDSTTWFRARICGTDENSILSDSFKVEVIKPFPPTGLNDTVCGPGLDPVRLRANNAFNIDRIRLYDSLEGGELIADRVVPFAYNDSLLKTDTFYLESVIKSSEVTDGECVSINRSPVIGVIDTIPDPPLVDFSLLDTCGSPTDPRAPGDPRTCFFRENGRNVLSICQDTSFLIDGGRKDGRRDTYEWTVINPDGSIVTAADSAALRNQTVVVDAFQLELNQTYGYSVVVTSDAGCQNITTPSGLPDATPDTIWVRITDSCVTSIAEVDFKQTFEIYPNPVSEELNIIHRSNQSFNGTIELLTIEGQLIQRDVNLNFGQLNHRIDMGRLPKGIYMIKVDSEKGSFVEKVIKN